MTFVSQRSPYTILVVDDDAATRILIRAALHAVVEVHTASDGNEAMEKAAANDYSVIITDLLLPRMTGVQFVQQFRRRFPEKASRTTVFALTGASHLFKLEPGDFAEVLNKPIDLKTLRERVERACGIAGEGESEEAPA